MSIDLLLWILAAISFLIAAFGLGGAVARVHFGWLGLLLASITFIV